MELQRMRYALALAEHGHFGRAAGALGMRQPALSQQIRVLEAQLGVRLFERGGKHTILTAAGRAYLDDARQAVAAAEAATRSARRVARGEAGRLAIGFVASAMYWLLPQTLRTFRTRYPDVQLDIEQLSSAEQIDRLAAGNLDIGFLRPPPLARDDPPLAFLLVAREPLMVFLPVDSPLARRRTIPVSALAGTPFVLIPRSLESATHDQILQVCREAGFEPTIAAYAQQVHSLMGLITAGFGVTFGPISVKGLAPPTVTYRALTPKRTIPNVTATWRQDDTNPVLANFTQVLHEASAHASEVWT